MKYLISIAILCLSLSLQAKERKLLLMDIGVIGLASHDLFVWDKDTKQNLENGRIDLSTIFDYQNGANIDDGGNPKNATNAAVYTVTQNLVSYFKGKKMTYLLSRRFTEEQAYSMARKETAAHFIALIKDSYQRYLGEDFPSQGQNAQVNKEEQAAMRALHDSLPGNVKIYVGLEEKAFSLTNFMTTRTIFSAREYMQEIPYFDGSYDPAFLAIVVPSQTGGLQTVSLKAADKEFIQGETNYKLEEMLDELGAYSKTNLEEALINSVSFAPHLRNLFSKGLCKINTDGSTNPWVPSNIPCQ